MRRPSKVTVARFRRIRWTMTVIFAGATALCLLVLALIAAQIDDASRRNALDTDLQQRVTSLAATAYYDAGTLTLDPLYDDSVARTTEAFGVVEGHSIVLASPDQRGLPADRVVSQLVSASRRQVAFAPAPAETGRRYQWAAASIADGSKVGATMIAGDDMTASITAHDRLLAGLGGTVLALTLAAAVVGHVLSGRAVRPIIRGLEAQEQFLVEAAHELRTPLTTLRLINDSGRRHPEDAATALARSRPQIDRLGRLIDGLLMRARIESRSQAVDLALLRLDQVAELAAEEVALVHDVTIETDLAATVVRGNADLLEQAIRNLLENAVRYADQPRLVVRPTLVEVADHGPGIPTAECTAALRAGRGSGRGTGTGLAIVSWVVSVHGGRMTLGDAPGGGLLVSIAFPEVASSSPHR